MPQMLQKVDILLISTGKVALLANTILNILIYKRCLSQACKGLCNIYSSRVMPVPKNEAPHLLSPRTKYSEITVGTWARLKNGNYKGDLAQVHHVLTWAEVL